MGTIVKIRNEESLYARHENAEGRDVSSVEAKDWKDGEWHEVHMAHGDRLVIHMGQGYLKLVSGVLAWDVLTPERETRRITDQMVEAGVGSISAGDTFTAGGAKEG